MITSPFKIGIALLCVFLALLPKGASSACQEVSKLKSFEALYTEQIALDASMWRTELKKVKDNSRDLPEPAGDIVEVIGFSKDGKVALRLETVRSNECGACGSVEIKDLKSDQVIDAADYQGTDTEPHFWQSLTPRTPEPTVQSAQIEKIAFKNLYLYKMLEKHGIQVNCSLKLEKFPLTFNHATITALIDKENQLQLSKAAAKKKLGRVYDPESSTDSYGGVSYPKVLGYIRSPFEPRLVIVVGYLQRGWEDDFASQISAKIFGAHLVDGFKTP